MNEYNNNDMGIELPSLKPNDDMQVVPETSVDAVAPVLSEPVSEPLAMPVMPEAPVGAAIAQAPVVEASPVVETPAINPMSEAPVMPISDPVVSLEPVAMPETPVTPVMPETNLANEPAISQTPVHTEEVTPVMQAIPETPVVHTAPVQELPTPAVEPVLTPQPFVTTVEPEVPVQSAPEAVPVAAPTAVNTKMHVVEASKTAKIIGTVVCLVIICLLGFWFIRNYLMVK